MEPKLHCLTSRILRVVFAGLLLAPMAGLAPAAEATQRLHKYSVAIDPDLTTLNVRACFDGKPPAELVAESLDAPLALIEARVEGSRKVIELSGSLNLRHVPENGCLLYSANVSKPIRQHDRTDGKIRRLGKDLLTSIGLWLWRPAELADNEDVEISFLLQDGLAVSAPWKPLAISPERAVFRLGQAPHDEPAYVAFGRFREREVRIGNSRLRLAVLEGSPPVSTEEMQEWIADAARIVSGLYGRFPVAQAQVLVVPDTRGAEPTPWAHVVRGGAPAVHFFVNQRRPIHEFYGDWTAVHEFSHLLLPLVNRDAAWLYEGVATYYQNVLRARAGRISPREAWVMMQAGFVRGRDDATGMTLAQATESMYRSGAYMRVYWEGTAIMLMADVRLRQMTAGKQSLDTALAALNECCSSPDRSWSAADLMGKLDEITGTGVFSELHDMHVAAMEFPDLTATYRALGIAREAGGIEFSTDERERQLREAIMETGVLTTGEVPAQ